MTPPRPERKPDNPVLIDTSVWVDYFRGKTPALLDRVDRLIDQRKARSLSIIVAELLRGCRTQKEVRAVQTTVGELPAPKFEDAFWIQVGLFCFGLASKGISCALVDGFIAKAAIESDFQLYTLDKDFKQIARGSALNLISA